MTNTILETDPLLRDVEAARILNVTPQTLRVWRSTGRYPLQFVKIGRAVRYRRSALESFIESRTATGTTSAR